MNSAVIRPQAMNAPMLGMTMFDSAGAELLHAHPQRRSAAARLRDAVAADHAESSDSEAS